MLNFCGPTVLHGFHAFVAFNISQTIFEMIVLNAASSSSSPAAEKVSSLGKDWHKFCLKCERCNKTLNPGGHAEV